LVPKQDTLEEDIRPVIKHKNIPILRNYRGGAEEHFWKEFPFNGLSPDPQSRVDAKSLEALIKENKERLTPCQVKRGLVVVANLKHGALAFQKTDLPPTDVPNSEKAYQNGAYLTDILATWIESGMVAGPFVTPPHYLASGLIL
jgi:hypothetical protein